MSKTKRRKRKKGMRLVLIIELICLIAVAGFIVIKGSSLRGVGGSDNQGDIDISQIVDVICVDIDLDPSAALGERTSKGFKIETENGVTRIDGIIIANKSYSLPKDFGDGITPEAQTAFDAMSAAAAEDGFDIWIQSGFRSYSTQKGLYNRYVEADGKAEADTYSARPGHSEHQLGEGMDLNIIEEYCEDTKEFEWLQENAKDYGFILRYPKGMEDVTGYIYEPWHYRYVGTELANTLYNGGDWITLEEYFGIDSRYAD